MTVTVFQAVIPRLDLSRRFAVDKNGVFRQTNGQYRPDIPVYIQPAFTGLIPVEFAEKIVVGGRAVGPA